jgi:hypothetical protein
MSEPRGRVSSLATVGRRLAVAAILTSAALAGATLGWSNKQQPLASGPLLVIDPDCLRLGKVDATPEHFWQLRIRNVSDRAVRVLDFKTSCACAQHASLPLALDPGKEAVVDLRINVAISGSTGATTHARPLEVQIVPVIEGYVVPQHPWKLTGTIVAPCLLERDRLVFAGSEAIISGQKAAPQSIRASLLSEDIEVTATPENPDDQVTITRQGDSRRQIDISVTPSAQRPQGWFTSPIDLVVRDGTGARRGELKIEIRGEVVSPIPMYPRTVTLGACPLGETAEARILVDCRQGQLLDASPMDAQTEVYIDRQNGKQGEVVVSFLVAQGGTQRRYVHLVYTADSGDVWTASVPIWFCGATPQTHTRGDAATEN